MTPTPPTERGQESDSGRRWRRRPALGLLIRMLVLLLPAVASGLVSYVVSRALPVPAGALDTALWWTAFLGAAIATWLVCERLLRRLLPLAALLDLTILFPDAAPSRFAMARRSSDARRLERELVLAHQSGSDEAPARRAETILALVAALNVHDRRTRGHSERVRLFTDLLAEELHLSRADRDRLCWASLLHDIGKLVVPAEVLNKKGAPDGGEWEVLHRHPIEGAQLIAPLREWLGVWADAVAQHHERYDGSGYPMGLRGNQISLGGRVVAVADSYETMTSARPYKTPMTVVAAREELVRMSGSHFDPVVVRAFLNISVGRLWRAVGFSAVLAEVPALTPALTGVAFRLRLGRLAGTPISTVAAGALALVLVASGVVGIPVTVPPSGGVLAAHTPEIGTPPDVPPGAQPDGQPADHPETRAGAPVTIPGLTPGGATAPNGVSGPSGTNSSGPTAGPGQPPAGGPPPSGGAAYPPGIQRQNPRQPPGISKKPDPFANWRKHH